MDKNNKLSKSLQHADEVINKYGKLLSKITQTTNGCSISLLPYNKTEIKNAIQTVLLEIGNQDSKLQDGLIQGYIILAQFISDEKIKILNQATEIFDKDNISTQSFTIADQANKIINNIKVEMEELMNEIQLYISKTTPNNH